MSVALPEIITEGFVRETDPSNSLSRQNNFLNTADSYRVPW